MTNETFLFLLPRLTRMMRDLNLDPSAMLVDPHGGFALVDGITRRKLTPRLGNQTMAEGIVAAIKIAEAAARGELSLIADQIHPPGWDEAGRALHVVEDANPGTFWMLSKGRVSYSEPLYGAALMFGASEVLTIGQGNTLAEAIESMPAVDWPARAAKLQDANRVTLPDREHPEASTGGSE